MKVIVHERVLMEDPAAALDGRRQQTEKHQTVLIASENVAPFVAPRGDMPDSAFMFESLSTRLQDVFKTLRGESRLTPENIEVALREQQVVRLLRNGGLGGADQLLPIGSDQLCYVKEGNAWKITGFIPFQ